MLSGLPSRLITIAFAYVHEHTTYHAHAMTVRGKGHQINTFNGEIVKLHGIKKGSKHRF